MIGEFSPPKELATMGTPRMSGRGAVDAGADGVAFDGRIVDVESAVPRWATAAVLGVALVINALAPKAAPVLLPLALAAVLGIVFLRYRAEAGRVGVFRVPWAQVEHVVRLPTDVDVIAIVLARPLVPRGPEQVFFRATDGSDALVEALRAEAPRELTFHLDVTPEPAEDPSPD